MILDVSLARHDKGDHIVSEGVEQLVGAKSAGPPALWTFSLKRLRSPSRRDAMAIRSGCEGQPQIRIEALKVGNLASPTT